MRPFISRALHPTPVSLLILDLSHPLIDHAQHSHEIGPANIPFTRKGRRELAEKAKNKRASTVVPRSTTNGGHAPATNQSYGSNHADDDDDDDGGADGSGGRSGLPLSPRSMEDGVDLNGIGGMDVEVDPVLQQQQPMSSNGLYTSPSAGPSGTANRGTAGMGLPTPHSITSTNGSHQGPVPSFQPLPAAPVSTASQHQQRLSIASSHRPPPPPQPQSQPQSRSQPQSALHSPQQAPPRVNGTLTGSAAALQAIFGPSATAQQITQDRWNRLELIFQHVRSQAVNYEFPGATLSALEMVSRHILLGACSGFYRRRLVVNTDVTRDPWNRHRPVATLDSLQEEWVRGREVTPSFFPGSMPDPSYLSILFLHHSNLRNYCSIVPLPCLSRSGPPSC